MLHYGHWEVTETVRTERGWEFPVLVDNIRSESAADDVVRRLQTQWPGRKFSATHVTKTVAQARAGAGGHRRTKWEGPKKWD